MKSCSISVRCSFPLAREAWVRNTAVLVCMVLCIEARRVDVGVLPFEDRKEVSSSMEARPMVGGEVVCGLDGGLCVTMWRAAALPYNQNISPA